MIHQPSSGARGKITDMEIDLRNGGVIVLGPMNNEEKAAHDKRVALPPSR